jgi:hypothetical protein
MATMTRDELVAALAGAKDLDDLLARLTPDVVEGLATRDDDDIDYVPVFTEESKGDGGEGWERISWDATRYVNIVRDYVRGGWRLRVDDRGQE